MSVFQDAIAARTIWGESRSESDLGKLAVAHVIRNRVRSGRWGTTAAAVCMAPMQYSCWNPHDPNRRLILELDELNLDLARCLYAWNSSAEGTDPTLGSTHYLVTGTYARWAEGVKPAIQIGHHSFFRDIA